MVLTNIIVKEVITINTIITTQIVNLVITKVIVNTIALVIVVKKILAT